MKRFVWFGLLAIGAVVGGALFAWGQVTQLPDWYAEETRNPAEIRAQAAQVINKLETQLTPQSTTPVTLSEQEVSDVLGATVQSVADQAHADQAFKGARVKLVDRTLKAGAVVDMQALKASKLSGPQQAWITRVSEQVPGLGDRTLYVGFTGSPQVKDGKVKLGSDLSVTIGNVSLPIKDLSDRIGISPDRIEQELNRMLPDLLQGIPIEQLFVENGQIVIRGDR